MFTFLKNNNCLTPDDEILSDDHPKNNMEHIKESKERHEIGDGHDCSGVSNFSNSLNLFKKTTYEFLDPDFKRKKTAKTIYLFSDDGHMTFEKRR